MKQLTTRKLCYVAGSLGIFLAPALGFGDTLNKTAEKAQTAAYDLVDKSTVVVDFKAGSANLTETEKRELRSTLNAYKTDYPVKGVVVAAWSDQEYPNGKGEALTDKQRNLAEDRAKAIRSQLAAAGVGSIEVFNMAEKPNWLEETFRTDDAKIKGEAKEKRDETSDLINQEVATTVRNKGGPNKAVVVLR